MITFSSSNDKNINFDKLIATSLKLGSPVYELILNKALRCRGEYSARKLHTFRHYKDKLDNKNYTLSLITVNIPGYQDFMFFDKVIEARLFKGTLEKGYILKPESGLYYDIGGVVEIERDTDFRACLCEYKMQIYDAAYKGIITMEEAHLGYADFSKRLGFSL